MDVFLYLESVILPSVHTYVVFLLVSILYIVGIKPLPLPVASSTWLAQRDFLQSKLVVLTIWKMALPFNCSIKLFKNGIPLHQAV